MTDLKQLAEWSRKFLADNTCYVLSSDMAESCLFHKWYIAPVLMHLGKREMEKRGFTWKIEVHKKKYRVKVDRPSIHYQKTQISTNEYIAFWLAVREALKGGK